MGRGAPEMLTLRIQDLTTAEDLPATESGLAQLQAGTIDRLHAEKQYRHPDGRTLWVEVHVALVRDGAGRPLHLVVQTQDITDRKNLERELAHLAHHDSLTGLPNRVVLINCLEQALRSARRTGRPLAVLLLDLDGFKEINDTLGHDSGDELLRQVASRLTATLRDSDTVARLGGDEFAVVLPDTDASGATTAAKKVVAALDAPLVVAGRHTAIRGSVGVACYPGHGADVRALLRRADSAMYTAKRGGGGVATSDMDGAAPATDHAALAADL
jgi:diguanylate cyclase (GGDEF)-like protein/PAS domain S-box-containing protein